MNTTKLFSNVEPILIVEDNLLNLKILARTLEKIGLDDFEHAENGAVAVDKYNEKSYQTVLMDIRMPVMDGIEATKKILKIAAARGEDPVIIAITADASPDLEKKCFAAGMKTFILKPIHVQDLFKAFSLNSQLVE